MEWFSIDMPPDSMADGAYHRLCRAFQRAFIDAGAPPDLALFAVRPGASSPRLYLTPSSGRYVPDLIRRHGGHRCATPDAAGVTLVYGVPGAKSLLRRLEEEPEERPTKTPIFPLMAGRRAASSR